MSSLVRETTVLWTVDPLPAVGLPAFAVVTSGKLNLTGFEEIIGEVFQNVLLAPIIGVQLRFYANPAGAPIYIQNVTPSGSLPAFTYPWKEPVRGRYVEVVVTNGAVPSASFRAFNRANPTT